ncbi:MAG TPA: CPBP family intramembrane glutamic endopeptidase [Chthonomonadaceae bacterium]|nr:CPBP family intramembrane glutamic endopeptidase [Chthonomonadaceae bacterium]
MPPIDKADSTALFLAALVVMAMVVIADVVLLIRWLIYQVQLNAAEAQFLPMPVVPPLAGPPEAEELPVPLYATVGAPAQAAPEEEARPAPEAEAREELPPTTPPPAPGPAYSLPRPPFAPTWSLVHPFIGFQVAMLLTVIVTLGLLVGLHLRTFLSPMAAGNMPPDVIVLSLFVQNVFFVGVVAFFLMRYGTSLRRIGLARPDLRRIFLGIALGFALVFLAGQVETGFMLALKHLVPAGTLARLQKLSDLADAGSLFPHMPSVWLKIAFILGGAVAAPIGEEVFFRGFVYNALKTRLNVPLAIVLSGLAFALVHFSPLALLPIWLMGMALAFTYERTRSLWVTILMHAVNNGSAFAALWIALHSGK